MNAQHSQWNNVPDYFPRVSDMHADIDAEVQDFASRCDLVLPDRWWDIDVSREVERGFVEMVDALPTKTQFTWEKSGKGSDAYWGPGASEHRYYDAATNRRRTVIEAFAALYDAARGAYLACGATTVDGVHVDISSAAYSAAMSDYIRYQGLVDAVLDATIGESTSTGFRPGHELLSDYP